MKLRILISAFVVAGVTLVATNDAEAQWRGRGGNWSVGVGNGGVWYGQGYGPNWSQSYYGNQPGWGRNYGYGPYYQSGWNVGYPQYGMYSGYNSYSTPTYYSSGSYATAPVYSGIAMASDPCGGAVYSSGQAVNNSNNQAMLRVQVPDSQARIWIQGTLMSQQGTERLFQSPPLEATKDYQYTVKATWRGPDQQEITREKVVDVRAGQQTLLSFADDRDTNSNSGHARMPLPSDQRPSSERRSGFESDPRGTARPQDARPREEQPRQDPSRQDPPRDQADFSKEALVVAVQDNSLTVKELDGDQQHVLAIRDGVKIKGDNGNVALRDLKAGQRVKLTFQGDGTDRRLVAIEARPLPSAP